jgi:hypothetical protein
MQSAMVNSVMRMCEDERQMDELVIERRYRFDNTVSLPASLRGGADAAGR